MMRRNVVHNRHLVTDIGGERDAAAARFVDSQSAASLTLIRPRSAWAPLDLAELWAHRELLVFLAWRDLKVRYKQTALGVLWAVVQPVATMLVFTLVFGRIAQVPVGDVPYPLFAFAGLLPWQLFSSALTDAGNSLVANRDLLTKVYLPRLLIPFAAVLASLVDLGVAFVLLLGLMAFERYSPGPTIVLLPAFIALALLTALAVGVWLAALNVRYRDIRYTIPFITQFLLFATPVAYPLSAVPEPWRSVLALNPLAAVVEGFRWALLGTTPVLPATLGISVAALIVLFVSGLYYFRRAEREFADVI